MEACVMLITGPIMEPCGFTWKNWSASAESAVNISYLLISNIKDNCNTALIAGQEMSPVSEAV